MHPYVPAGPAHVWCMSAALADYEITAELWHCWRNGLQDFFQKYAESYRFLFDSSNSQLEEREKKWTKRKTVNHSPPFPFFIISSSRVEQEHILLIFYIYIYIYIYMCICRLIKYYTVNISAIACCWLTWLEKVRREFLIKKIIRAEFLIKLAASEILKRKIRFKPWGGRVAICNPCL